jgi:CheY-like chemotaxis protein
VLQTETLEPGAIVQDLSQMIERLIGEHIKLAVNVAPDAGAVDMDRSQLEQIVMNLVVNARDAMPSGGQLSIDVSPAELDRGYASAHVGVEPGEYVLIAVSDSGVGMSPEVQKQIFEPFFTTKESDRGTGLGLATVYGIVKNLKGNVWVYSEPGRGSVFKVYLPVAGAMAMAPRSGDETRAASAGNETILVVEDEATIREMTEMFLTGVGYRVLTASDGGEALERLAAEPGPIAAIVTDVVLPRLSGLEVAGAARARDPKTRVIFVSGYTDDAEIRRAIVSEGAEFLQKPFPLAVLAARIRAAIDRPA